MLDSRGLNKGVAVLPTGFFSSIPARSTLLLHAREGAAVERATVGAAALIMRVVVAARRDTVTPRLVADGRHLAASRWVFLRPCHQLATAR